MTNATHDNFPHWMLLLTFMLENSWNKRVFFKRYALEKLTHTRKKPTEKDLIGEISGSRLKRKTSDSQVSVEDD